MSQRRILVLFAHPALEKSRVNRELVEAARALDGVTLHDLYEHYPDFDVDVEREQALLLDHEVVVFQHPFFWYSTPALLKEWQDLVLTYGWAYGKGGTALAGKRFLSAITTGAPEDAYCQEGANGCSMSDFLRPLEMTARLCGMEWLEPFIVYGTHRLTREGIRARADAWRERLLELSGALRAR